MSLEATYWLLLGLGLGMLVLSLVVGDLFDFLDFDFPGGDFSATPVFFTAAAAFGGGGLIGIHALDLEVAGSLLTGLAAAVLLGGLAALLFAALHRQEAADGFVTDQLKGSRGRCTLAISPGTTGRVSITHSGMTRSFSATSEEAIASGEDVVVIEAMGNSLTVTRATKASTQG